MSYNSNNYHIISSSRSAIAKVSAGTSNILRYSCGTRFEKFSSFFTWTVKGLTTLPAGTTSVESIPFCHQNASKWCMVLTKESTGLHLSFLLREFEADKHLRAYLQAVEILPTSEQREVFPRNYYLLLQGGKSESKLVRETGASQNEDEITLQCEVCIQCIIQDELPIAEAAEPHVCIVQGLDEMFDNKIHTDFDLHVGGTILKAHRAILSVRSPYFAAMLQPHTKEAKEGHVDVLDMKPEVCNQVLLYMYTGVAPALKDMPWDLLIAADKYQLHHLKGQCETHIASSLNVDNAAETAANAKVFTCDVLWDRAVLYIKQNLCKVMRTSGWNDIITAHPKAIQEISNLME